MTKLTRSSFFFLILRFAVTFLIFWVIIRRLDFSGFVHAFTHINPVIYGFVLVLGFVTNVFSAKVLEMILVSIDLKIGFMRILKANYFSYYYAFLGFLVGGVARWHFLAYKDNKHGPVLWGILVERFFLILGCSLVFLVSEWANGYVLLNPSERKFLYLLTVVLVIVLFLGSIIFLNRSFHQQTGLRIDQWIRALPLRNAWKEKLLVFFQQDSDHSICFRTMSRATGYAFLHYAASILGFFLIVQAVGFSVPLVVLVWIFMLNSLAEMLPVTVFGLGVREGIFVYFLPRYGVPLESCLVIGILFFVASVFYASCGGLWYFWSHIVDLRKTGNV